MLQLQHCSVVFNKEEGLPDVDKPSCKISVTKLSYAYFSYCFVIYYNVYTGFNVFFGNLFRFIYFAF